MTKQYGVNWMRSTTYPLFLYSPFTPGSAPREEEQTFSICNQIFTSPAQSLSSSSHVQPLSTIMSAWLPRLAHSSQAHCGRCQDFWEEKERTNLKLKSGDFLASGFCPQDTWERSWADKKAIYLGLIWH